MPAAEKGELIHGLTVKEVDALSKGCLEARQRAYSHDGRLGGGGARAASAARDKEEKADALAGPYSQFRVGAALLIHPTSTSRFASTPNSDDAPQIILGANVENAAYPVGTCAERVAVGTAVTSFGYGRGDIKAVGVATDLREEHCSPCGMCRQFLREFLELDTPIFMHTSEGKYVVKTMGELLPMSFGPDVLPPPEKLLAQRQEQGNGAK